MIITLLFAWFLLAVFAGMLWMPIRFVLWVLGGVFRFIRWTIR